MTDKLAITLMISISIVGIAIGCFVMVSLYMQTLPPGMEHYIVGATMVGLVAVICTNAYLSV